MDGCSLRLTLHYPLAALTLLLNVALSHPVAAAESDAAEEANEAISGSSYEDDSHVGYDSILRQLNREAAQQELSSSRARASLMKTTKDPFESIWIHMGVGLAHPMQTLSLGDGKSAYVGSRGIQAALGIDLFSEHWMAEGTARSFAESEDANTRVSLKEFELKIYYKDRITKPLAYRLGGGITGRYMTIARTGDTTLEYTTPSSVGTMGLDFFLTEKLSLGADLSVRSSMVSDTLDRSSVDATLRMDTHF